MIKFLGHTGVVGATRHGKTYATMQSLDADARAVLFFNVQHEDTPPGFMVVTGETSVQVIKRCLRGGDKLNFVPDTRPELQERQLSALINMLYDGSTWDMILAVDECHLFKREGLSQLKRVATTGLRWGITLVPITQRLAGMDNFVMTQLTSKVVFATNDEGPYFKQYGIPRDEIERRIWSLPQIDTPFGPRTYGYCVWDGREVSGPFKV